MKHDQNRGRVVHHGHLCKQSHTRSTPEESKLLTTKRAAMYACSAQNNCIYRPFLSSHSQFLPWSWKCVSCCQDLAICPASAENATKDLLRNVHTPNFDNWPESTKASYRNFLLRDDDSWVLATDPNGGHPSLVDGFECILWRKKKQSSSNNHPHEPVYQTRFSL